jgi:hypothetical protein
MAEFAYQAQNLNPSQKNILRHEQAINRARSARNVRAQCALFFIVFRLESRTPWGYGPASIADLSRDRSVECSR